MCNLCSSVENASGFWVLWGFFGNLLPSQASLKAFLALMSYSPVINYLPRLIYRKGPKIHNKFLLQKLWLKAGISALLYLEVLEARSSSCLGGGNWISDSFLGRIRAAGCASKGLLLEDPGVQNGSDPWLELSSRLDQRIWLGGVNDLEGKATGFPVGKGHHHLNIKLVEFLRLEKTNH